MKAKGRSEEYQSLPDSRLVTFMNAVFLRDDHEEHVEKVKHATLVRENFITKLFKKKEKKLAQALVDQDTVGNDTEITIKDFKRTYDQIDKTRKQEKNKDTYGL